MQVKHIKIEICPETRFAGGREVYECRIEAEVWGREKYILREMIPEDDFNSRFEWFIDRAKKEIKSAICG